MWLVTKQLQAVLLPLRSLLLLLLVGLCCFLASGEERITPPALHHHQEGKVIKNLPTSSWDGILTIVVITNAATKSRFSSLQRLIQSLLDADYALLEEPQQEQEQPGCKHSLRLHINIDSNTVPEAIDYLIDLEWPFGPKTVNRRIQSAGLVKAVAESWYPATDDEVGLLLEDDIEVSPLYYHWLYHAMNAVAGSDSASDRFYDDKLLGISLYTPRRVEVNNKDGKYRFDASQLMKNITGDPTSPYLHQLPCSWGALYFGRKWRQFIAYMEKRLLQEAEQEDSKNATNISSRSLAVKPPYSSTPGWKTSWKKFMIEIMYVKDWYMLYPSFPNQVSFSTNHLEIGEHITENDVDHRPDDYTVPLFQNNGDLNAFKAFRSNPLQVPPLKDLPALDLLNNPLADLDYLWSLQEHEQQQDSNNPYRYSHWSPKNESVTQVLVSPDKSSGPRGLFLPRKRESVCKDFNAETNRLLSSSPNNRNNEKKVTLLIATFDRFDVLQMQLEYYTQSSRIDLILVTWHDIHRPSPPPMHVNGTLVEFIPQAKDSLNNRFLPSMRITTQAVIVMDDDMKVHLEDIELLYETWSAYQDKIVGFYPRRITGDTKYSVDGADRWDEPYHLMLTKAMILDKRFLEAYSCGEYMPAVHKIVDENMNCEDIAMNFVVSYLTMEAAPLFVESIHFIGDFGDSRFTQRAGVKGSIHQSSSMAESITHHLKLNHVDARTSCYRDFSKLFNFTNGLPAQRFKIQSSEEGKSNVVSLSTEPMGQSRKTKSYRRVRDFTSICGFVDDRNRSQNAKVSWVRVEKEGSVIASKKTGPDDACGFNRPPASTTVQFRWTSVEPRTPTVFLDAHFRSIRGKRRPSGSYQALDNAIDELLPFDRILQEMSMKKKRKTSRSKKKKMTKKKRRLLLPKKEKYTRHNDDSWKTHSLENSAVDDSYPILNITSDIDFSRCILIFGAYKNGNLGDVAQPKSVETLLRSLDKDACIFASASAQKAVQQPSEYRIGEIFFAERRYAGDLNCSKQSADIVNRFGAFVIGGGGLLTSPHHPLDCSEFEENLRDDLPILFLGVGSENDIAVKEAGGLLKRAKRITVRDSRSMETIKRRAYHEIDGRLSLLRDPIFSDPALTYNLNQQRCTYDEPRRKGDPGPICFVLPGHDKKNLHALHETISSWVDQTDVLINIFPKYKDEIRPYYDQRGISRYFDAVIEPEKLQEIFCDCRAVVSSRLHGVIFGLHSGIPTIALYFKRVGKLFSLIHDVLEFDDDMFLLANGNITRNDLHAAVANLERLYEQSGRREAVFKILKDASAETMSFLALHKDELFPWMTGQQEVTEESSY